MAPPTSERGDYYRWLFFVAGPLEAAATNKALSVDIPVDKQGMVGYGTLERVVDTLSAAVARRAFIAGEKFSAADVYVGSHINWGMQFGTLPKHPQFLSYWDRLADRSAYRRAGMLDDELAKTSAEAG
jgi:glutathione S-transferase